MPLIVAFEGPDGVGKSTQSKLLAAALQNAGYKATTFSWPCDGVFGSEIIKAMLINGSAKKNPNVFQALYSLNKVLFQTQLLPRMKDFDVVILDRWALSTRAYSKATGVHPMIRFIGEKILKKPDITFVFLGKSFDRVYKDSYEADEKIQTVVRNEYEKLCEKNKNLIRIAVDNCVPLIHTLVLVEVAERLP